MELSKIKDFWQWFEKNEEKYYALNPDNAEILINKISNRLQRLQKGLSVHFSGELIDEKKEFIISADGDKELFPSVFEIMEHAPSLTLSHWVFKALKPRVKSLSDNYRIGMNENSLAMKDIFFVIKGNSGSSLDIEIYFKNTKDINDFIIEGTFHLLDYLLGEYDVETKIGIIDFKKYTANIRSLNPKPLLELPQSVDSLLH